MKITSIQKVIKVGSSLAVTIPARDAKRSGIVAGEEVKIEVTPLVAETPEQAQKLTTEYEAFKLQYGETLKNLSER